MNFPLSTPSLDMASKKNFQLLPLRGAICRPLYVAPGCSSPARSKIVGRKSMTVQNASVIRLPADLSVGVDFAGFKTSGTRQPPWVENILYSLDGAVAAWAHLGPYHTNELRRPILSSELS